MVSAACNAEPKCSSSLTLSPLGKKGKSQEKKKVWVHCVDNVRVVDIHRSTFQTFLCVCCLRKRSFQE